MVLFKDGIVNCDLDLDAVNSNIELWNFQGN
jgi:hypothetical protein